MLHLLPLAFVCLSLPFIGFMVAHRGTCLASSHALVAFIQASFSIVQLPIARV
jgi:hypothetical protein